MKVLTVYKWFDLG